MPRLDSKLQYIARHEAIASTVGLALRHPKLDFPPIHFMLPLKSLSSPMAISSHYRRYSLSDELKALHCSPLLTRLYYSAPNYWKVLQSNDSPEPNLEKTLTKIGGKLTSSTVVETLQKCSTDTSLSLSGLRFFIWAGHQPNYRHTSFTYNKACKFFEIGAKRRSFCDVLEIYRKGGCLVSVNMFKVILNLCREANLADEAVRVLRKMSSFACQPDTTVFNLVIGLVCQKGEMDMAQGLMKEMTLINLYPDMSTYIAMVKGFCNVGRLEDACGLIKVMSDNGCVPNVVVYSTLIDGFCRVGNFDIALEMLAKLEEENDGRMPNVVTYTSLIQRFCENGRTSEALTILHRMVSQGCFPNRVTVATLMKHLCSDGNIEEAYKLIDKVVVNGNVSRNECYSSLVVSLLQNKHMDEAEKLIRWMLENNIRLDGLASSTLVKQLCLEGQIRKGFEYFTEMEKMDWLASVDSDVYSILLLGLCQQGQFVEAARLIDVMINKKIKLKAPYANTIVKFLHKSSEKELALDLIIE